MPLETSQYNHHASASVIVCNDSYDERYLPNEDIFLLSFLKTVKFRRIWSHDLLIEPGVIYQLVHIILLQYSEGEFYADLIFLRIKYVYSDFMQVNCP